MRVPCCAFDLIVWRIGEPVAGHPRLLTIGVEEEDVGQTSCARVDKERLWCGILVRHRHGH